MNLNKMYGFFHPDNLKGNVHVIGCGAVGSHIAEQLTRMGVPHLILYDEDIVVSHNLTNQIYRFNDIGEKKVDALTSILKEINPDLKVTPKGFANADTRLNGYIFLAVDNIDTRKEILGNNWSNRFIKLVIDPRMGLTDGQIHSADWENEKQKKNLKNGMQFTHEEAVANYDISPCGTTLNVIPTVQIIAANAVANFINFVNTGECTALIMMNAFKYAIITM